MKLLNKEIAPRLTITLDKSMRNDKVSGSMRFGEDNAYPQKIEKLILGSQSAKSAANSYAKYIAGSSFENPEIGSQIIGIDNKGKSVTLDRMRIDIAKSLAWFGGAKIHTNMSINGTVGRTKLIPFKDCRYSAEDGLGYCGFIGIDRDWTNARKKNVSWYPNFSTDEKTIVSQIEYAKSVGEEFKGQIYTIDLDNSYLYPLSPFDSVVLDMDSEHQVQVFKNNELRNGFTDKIVMHIELPEDERDADKTIEKVKSFLGADGDKFLLFDSEFDDDGNLSDESNYKFEVIKSNINSDLFKDWEARFVENIRKAVSLPSLLIEYDSGGLGNSGESMKVSQQVYNSETEIERTLLSNALKDIYSHSENTILRNNTNWNIKPLELKEYGVNTELSGSTGN